MGTKKPKPKPRRGKHSVDIEGAIVFTGNVTVFKSTKHLGRYIIVADSRDLGELEVVDSKESE